MVTCYFCGANSDGQEGWKEDHEIVCFLAPTKCPSSDYGCSATMTRFEVGVHLRTACPVAIAPCRLLVSESGPVPTLSESPLSRCCNAGYVDVVLGLRRSCGVSLRRLDMDRHYLFAHPDFGFLNQPCPYSASILSAQLVDMTERSDRKQFLATAASPLHPPPERFEKRGKQFTKSNFGYSGCELADCGFRRNHLKAFLPAPHIPKSERTGSNEGSVALVFEKNDLILRILDYLCSGTLQIFACVNKASRASCNDSMLRPKRKMASTRWDRRLCDETKFVRWESEIVWETPLLSPHISKWRFDVCSPWKHFECCPSRFHFRSLEEMELAAQCLGQMSIASGQS
jgi:hypothetical protein